MQTCEVRLIASVALSGIFLFGLVTFLGYYSEIGLLIWFLFCYDGSDDAITLGDKKEFRNWKWMSMDDLVSIVVPFRKPVYQELAEYLSRQQKNST